MTYGRVTGMMVGEPWSSFQIPYGVSQLPPRTLIALLTEYSTQARSMKIDPALRARPRLV
jgi:hypothetical protein